VLLVASATSVLDVDRHIRHSPAERSANIQGAA
jgi:hypothetical protein